MGSAESNSSSFLQDNKLPGTQQSEEKHLSQFLAGLNCVVVIWGSVFVLETSEVWLGWTWGHQSEPDNPGPFLWSFHSPGAASTSSMAGVQVQWSWALKWEQRSLEHVSGMQCL
jgi:hypothetical protein